MLGGAVIAGTLVQHFDVTIAPGVWCMACFSLGGCGIIVGLCIKDDTACFEEEEDCGSTCSGSTIVDSRSSVQGENEKTEDGKDRAVDEPCLTHIETMRRVSSRNCTESPV